MDSLDKEVSNNKSIELFGMTNEQHYGVLKIIMSMVNNNVNER